MFLFLSRTDEIAAVARKSQVCPKLARFGVESVMMLATRVVADGELATTDTGVLAGVAGATTAIGFDGVLGTTGASTTELEVEEEEEADGDGATGAVATAAAGTEVPPGGEVMTSVVAVVTGADTAAVDCCCAAFCTRTDVSAAPAILLHGLFFAAAGAGASLDADVDVDVAAAAAGVEAAVGAVTGGGSAARGALATVTDDAAGAATGAGTAAATEVGAVTTGAVDGLACG